VDIFLGALTCLLRQEKDTVLNRGTPDQLIRQILGDIAYNIQGVFCAKMLHEPAVDKVLTLPSL